MKKKTSIYAEILEKERNQLKADGKTDADIQRMKRKKPFGWFRQSKKKK